MKFVVVGMSYWKKINEWIHKLISRFDRMMFWRMKSCKIFDSFGIIDEIMHRLKITYSVAWSEFQMISTGSSQWPQENRECGKRKDRISNLFCIGIIVLKIHDIIIKAWNFVRWMFAISTFNYWDNKSLSYSCFYLYKIIDSFHSNIDIPFTIIVCGKWLRKSNERKRNLSTSNYNSLNHIK